MGFAVGAILDPVGPRLLLALSLIVMGCVPKQNGHYPPEYGEECGLRNVGPCAEGLECSSAPNRPRSGKCMLQSGRCRRDSDCTGTLEVCRNDAAIGHCVESNEILPVKK
jgi:hypothetical protein